MKRPTIVIIDDDPDMRYLARAALQHVDPDNKLQVLEAPDGPSALRLVAPLIAARIPLLLLCDQRMPGMTGSEVGVAFRRLRGTAPGRFILFSSLQGGTQIDPKHPGVDQVLEKGFGTREWREQIGNVVRAWTAALSQP